MADLVSEMAGNKLGLRKHEALNGRNVSKIVKTNGFVGFLLYIYRDIRRLFTGFEISKIHLEII